MTKQPLADDLEQASTLHREALAKIVFDMAHFLSNRRSDLKRKAARLRSKGRHAEAKEQSEAADVYADCFEKLRELKKKYGLQSARQSVTHCLHESCGDGQVITDPTPEEIADECRKFQEGWSDAVRELRSSFKHEPAETKTVEFGRSRRRGVDGF
jgi:hypothetical protein